MGVGVDVGAQEEAIVYERNEAFRTQAPRGGKLRTSHMQQHARSAEQADRLAARFVCALLTTALCALLRSDYYSERVAVINPTVMYWLNVNMYFQWTHIAILTHRIIGHIGRTRRASYFLVLSGSGEGTRRDAATEAAALQHGSRCLEKPRLQRRAVHRPA